MVYTADGSTAVIGIGDCQSLLEATLLGLGNGSHADRIGRDTHLFDVFLQSLLHFVELAIDTLQPIACYLLVLAQVLGIAIYGYIARMDIRDDWLGALGTHFGGLEPYPACSSVDANRTQTSENNFKIIKI